MKFTIIAIITLSILLGVTYSKDGHFPRSEITCDGTTPGLFWDGQKCERCANEHCFCNKYNTCDSCAPGYALGQVGKEDKPRCFKCPGNTRDCCFHGLSTDYENQKNPELITDADIDNNSYFIKRALSCNLGKHEGDTRLFGGFCQYIPGCSQYNEFGQCFECHTGYYFNSEVTYGNQVCIKCAEGCKKCRQAGQCDECIDGLYLETNVDRFTMHSSSEETEITAAKPLTNISSMCLKCDDNCKCSGKIDPAGTDTPLTCDLGCISKRFLFNETTEEGQQNTCEICPDHCAECEMQEEQVSETETRKVKKCIKCLETSANEDGDKIYIAPIDNEGTCQVCPDNCAQCEILDGKPSCLKDSCLNGYYPSKSTKTNLISCVACNSESSPKDVKYVLRCKSWSRPTQCGNPRSQFVSQSVAYAQQQPTRTMYYLLDIGNGKGECHQSGKYCKQIKKKTNGEIVCATCYEDQGYLYDPETGECSTCGDLQNGCAVCEQSSQQILCKECIKSGYILEQGRCEHCAKFCNQCTESGSGSCDEDHCVAGYFYVAATTERQSFCDQCTVNNCQKCGTKNSCQQCIPKYSLWKKPGMNTDSDNKEDYLCLMCPQNCSLCQDEFNGDRRVCTACEPGHYLKDGVCHVKKAHCQTYDINGGACEYCEYGYRLVDGYCVPSINIPQGYVNEAFGCKQQFRYRDDGAILNMEEFDNWEPPLYDGSANILSVSLLLVLSLFVLA